AAATPARAGAFSRGAMRACATKRLSFLRLPADHIADHLREHLWRLSSLDQPALIEDGRRHRLYALVTPKPFGVAYLRRILVRRQDLPSARRIKPGIANSVEERRMIAGRALIGEVQLEQRFFQLETRAFQFSPMQKPMRIEGVPDAALGPVIEG